MKQIILLVTMMMAFSACSSKPKSEESAAEPKTTEQSATESQSTETKTSVQSQSNSESQTSQSTTSQSIQTASSSSEKSVSTEAKTEAMENESQLSTTYPVADESEVYEETTTTTVVNENLSQPRTRTVVVEEYTPILGTELAEFTSQDYYEYEETHGVRTYYEPSTEEFITSNDEVERFKIDNGISTFSSAASSRRFITESNGVSSFENGLYETSKRCYLRSGPSKQSDVLGVVPVGKVVWADDSEDRWARVYREKGPAYIHKGCL